MVKPKRILVPTDFSQHSARAYQRALDVAKSSGAEIVLFHVIDQDIPACTKEYCLEEEEVTRQEKTLLEGAKKRLQKEIETFPVSDLKVSTVVREGVPYEEILKYQDLNDVDLIVIASHGRSAVAKYFLGSVSSNVLKGAKCEVLLVK
ncbi:MAG TPA: universal stress protein [Syntrophorhabdaceae bacterium]|nr:universal stress protein [Syntrophorhabdaceae bacterium]